MSKGITVSRTTTPDPAKLGLEDIEALGLEELEALNEDCNVRRGKLVARRKRLAREATEGSPVHREIRQIDRELDELQRVRDDYQPFLVDARARVADRARRARELDRLERDIVVLEDVLAFQAGLEDLVAEHLAPHLGASLRESGGGMVPSRYAHLARQVIAGPLHLNGSPYTTAGQVREALQRARRRVAEIREEAAHA